MKISMRSTLFLAVLVSAPVCRGEMECFRTVAEAAAQAGVREGGGFRLESVRRDPFGGKTWAIVRSCAHPERPAVAVAGVFGIAAPSSGGESSFASGVSDVVVRGGTRVTVLEVESMLRLQMTGIAQASGRIGDRVWVRILSPESDGIGRLALAVVRSADCLEIVE